MKARWSGPGFSTVPRPSRVVICRPSKIDSGVRQENTALPSTTTVQAPHWPRPQPNFAPLSARSSRSTYSRGVAGSASMACACPFTVKVIMGALRHVSLLDNASRRVPLRADAAHLLRDLGPGWLIAEAGAQVGDEIDHLRLGERAGEARHDAADRALGRLDAAQHHPDHVARVGTVEGRVPGQRAERERHLSAALVAGGAHAGVDRRSL